MTAQLRGCQITPALRAQLEAQMGKVSFALSQLLTRSQPRGTQKIKPEAKLSIDLADRLRALTKEYNESGKRTGLRAVWTKVANERQASWYTHWLLRSMGMIAGAYDFWFVWEGGGALIELKVGAGDLSPDQGYFETWAQFAGAHKAVHRSVEGALQSLREWGALI